MNLHFKTNFTLWAILIIGLLWSGPTLHSQEQNLPERIMVNPLESAHTGIAVTWRNQNSDNKQFIQWSRANGNPIVVEVEADANRNSNNSTIHTKLATQVQHTVTYKDNSSLIASYRVILSDLNPGLTYMYRVGNNIEGWSEWIQFELPNADPDSTLTFIYLGDPQNDLRSQWSRVIREAYSTAPESDFILYAGDLVNNGYNDNEWKDWYDAGSFIHRMIPSILTPGNHEYTDVILTPLWRSHFSLPENGPSGIDELKGACYYVDYPDLRVISLDGEQIDEDPQMRLAMIKWLTQLLEQNTKKWVVMTMHYPFYSTKPDRSNPKLRKAFKPIVDKFGVDLILQGHDHGYGRGMLDRMENGPVNEGTMYVVSVSGPKMYDVGHEKWMQKRGENLQLFQVIKIKGDKLNYKSFTTAGTLYDAFTLEKAEKGSSLIEK